MNNGALLVFVFVIGVVLWILWLFWITGTAPKRKRKNDEIEEKPKRVYDPIHHLPRSPYNEGFVKPRYTSQQSQKWHEQIKKDMGVSDTAQIIKAVDASWGYPIPLEFLEYNFAHMSDEQWAQWTTKWNGWQIKGGGYSADNPAWNPHDKKVD